MKTCKAKKCRWCTNEFMPWNSTQVNCSPTCALCYIKDKQERGLALASKKEESLRKRDIRARKQALKSKADWLRECQVVFNKFIRLRDENENCISCGNVPKKRNAGHYLSVGAYPELRFCECNVHLQCEHCNTYKSGNQVNYREALKIRIGIKKLDWLEGKHEAKHYTIDDIKEIKQYYREQLKIIKG